MIEKAVAPEIVDHDGNGQGFKADNMMMIAALSLAGLAGAALYYQLNNPLTKSFGPDPDFMD